MWPLDAHGHTLEGPGRVADLQRHEVLARLRPHLALVAIVPLRAVQQLPEKLAIQAVRRVHCRDVLRGQPISRRGKVSTLSVE